MSYWRYGGYYQPTSPLPVKEGLKIRSQRGKIGDTWWSGKWVAFLESLNMGARLGRGRNYARRGQIMNMDVQTGLVTAKVQGSQPQPYKVNIRLTPLSSQEWEEIIDAMASQALFAAKLLAGEMPHNIEEAFQAARLSLFPSGRKDLQCDCSCPDWANPCKHIAAVYYLLAEEFDRDPFLLFLLRGKDKDGLLDGLRQRRVSGDEQAAVPEEKQTAPQRAESVSLEDSLGRFWTVGSEMASFQVRISAPEVPLAILKRLGPPSFWSGKGDITDILGHAYGIVSQAALKLAYNSDDK